MIQIKLGNIINNIDKLQTLSNTKLKARAAYQIGKLLKEVERETKSFQEARIAAINKYCELDSNGTIRTNEQGEVVFKDNESRDAFITEINELLNVEVTLNAEQINLDDLNEIEFTPEQILELDNFIKE